MKVTKLTISNIGKISETELLFNKSLNLFYGDIMAGKTTILNSIKLCFGGSFPQDIIKHDEKEAFVNLAFDTGFIRREFYIAKDGTTKARAIQFVNDGVIAKKPIEAIKQFLNPFLLDQNFLIEKSEDDRRKYFTELFGVDTSEFDNKLKDCASIASDLRVKIKAYGEIDTTEVVKPDTDKLNEEKKKIDSLNDTIISDYKESCTDIDEKNKLADKRNEDIKRGQNSIDESRNDLDEIANKIKTLEAEKKANLEQIEKIGKWISEHPELPKTEHPESPELNSLAEIEEEISNSKADNVRYEHYLENIKKYEKKKADEVILKAKTARQKEIKAAKVAKLSEISSDCKIDGLSFDENGNFMYNGTSAGMLSTSQLMTLSSELSNLYPEGFGIELIDRGESLGKSIFSFVEKAQAEEKTILATIVGERPADTPDDIGVFVVENGNISQM